MSAYDNPGGLIAMSVILEVFAVGAVVLRFLARRKLGHGYGPDDWLILAALVPATGLAVLEIWGVHATALGTPLGASAVNSAAYPYRTTLTGYVEFSFMVIATPALGLIKLSLAFLYYRIFAHVWFRRICVVWIVILVLFTVTFTISSLAQCGDHLKAALASFNLQAIYCTSTEPVGLAYILGDPITDFIALVLPMPVIFGLRLPLRRKLLLALVFVFAFLSLFASCARAWVYLNTDQFQDLITMYTVISVWNYIEVQIGIMVACAPLLRCMLPKTLGIQKTRAAFSNIVHAAQSFIRSRRNSRSSPSGGDGGSDAAAPAPASERSTRTGSAESQMTTNTDTPLTKPSSRIRESSSPWVPSSSLRTLPPQIPQIPQMSQLTAPRLENYSDSYWLSQKGGAAPSSRSAVSLEQQQQRYYHEDDDEDYNDYEYPADAIV